MKQTLGKTENTLEIKDASEFIHLQYGETLEKQIFEHFTDAARLQGLTSEQVTLQRNYFGYLLNWLIKNYLHTMDQFSAERRKYESVFQKFDEDVEQLRRFALSTFGMKSGKPFEVDQLKLTATLDDKHSDILQFVANELPHVYFHQYAVDFAEKYGRSLLDKQEIIVSYMIVLVSNLTKQLIESVDWASKPLRRRLDEERLQTILVTMENNRVDLLTFLLALDDEAVSL